MDLKDYSFGALQMEMAKRVTEKEQEINRQFAEEAARIKDKFARFREFGMDLPDCICLRDVTMDDRYHHMIENMDELNYRRAKEVLSMKYTPRDLLNYWEKLALGELDRQRQETIRKLKKGL